MDVQDVEDLRIKGWKLYNVQTCSRHTTSCYTGCDKPSAPFVLRYTLQTMIEDKTDGKVSTFPTLFLLYIQYLYI